MSETQRSGGERSVQPSGASPSDGREKPGQSVSVIVVTYNALPWIEPCLASARGHELIVVDHGSTDGTVDFVRRHFPEAAIHEQPNLGLAAGWNAGLRVANGDWFFLLNADAWVVGDAVEKLVAVAESCPDAAVVGPRLRNPDGTLQRSVRGFPTLWRLATEYLFLRKLAPWTRALNAFYAGGFHHDRRCEAEFLMGAALLVRPEAVSEIGTLDERFFLFSEEVDWCFRFHRAGWRVLFTPAAEAVHVGGVSHGGRFFREQLLGHLRFMAKHRGRAEAERARRLLAVALTIRGALFRGARGSMYRDGARWLRSSSLEELLAWRR